MSYDALGNLTSKTGVGSYGYGLQSASCAAGALDKAHAAVTAGSTSYCYDRNGNMQTGGAWTYTWNADNTLASMTNGSAPETYTYDADGERVVRTAGSVTTVFFDGVWEQIAGGTTTLYTQDLASPLTQILQTKVGAATATDYIYGLSRLASLNGSTTTWYAADALGSVRRTFNTSATPLGIVNYDPWGTPECGAVPTFGFTGELQDTTTGLVNLRARWYSTTQGRFSTRDPWAGSSGRSQTLNQYGYVGDNPINLRDPNGRCYPPVEFLRDVEPLNCSNLDQAWRIAQHPNATFWQRIQANTYIVGWYGSHIGLVVGALGTGYAALDAGLAWMGQAASAYLAAHGGVATAVSWGGVALNLGTAGLVTYQAACGDENARATAFAMGALSSPVALPAESSAETEVEAHIGIIVRPRYTLGPDDAGHFAVYTDIGGDIQVRGYWPRNDSLPDDNVFDFLFNNRAPAGVRNDASMLLDVGKPGVIRAQRVVTLAEAQQLRTMLGEAGSRDTFYSFNPDNFPETFNCVTWGCAQVNKVFEPPITAPRQGRIKFALPLIKDLLPPWEVTVGE